MSNIFQLFLFNFIFLCLIFCFKAQTFEAINYGAYKTVPNSDNLQYRLGNGLGYIGNGWDDARMSNLSRKAGYDTQRKKLPEDHFKNWGYGIELGDAKINTQLGILDVVGYYNIYKLFIIFIHFNNIFIIWVYLFYNLNFVV